jgi:Fur family peroxide stress response transcriptional regulator
MIGLATIYKTIAILKEMGEIKELHFLSEGARIDGYGNSSHPHLFCTKCNRIQDLDYIFEIGGYDGDALIEEVMQNTGFKVNDYRLDFFGICPNCQPKK